MRSNKNKESVELFFTNTFGVPDVDIEIVHCIHHIKKGMEINCSRDMADYDLSIAQLDIISNLMFKGSCSSTDLSKRLNVSKANLTGMINRLESRGFVARYASEEDGRSKIIDLTKEGKKLVNKVVPKFIHTMSDILKEIPENEKQKLVSNLLLIINSLNENKED